MSKKHSPSRGYLPTETCANPPSSDYKDVHFICFDVREDYRSATEYIQKLESTGSESRALRRLQDGLFAAALSKAPLLARSSTSSDNPSRGPSLILGDLSSSSSSFSSKRQKLSDVSAPPPPPPRVGGGDEVDEEEQAQIRAHVDDQVPEGVGLD